MDWQNILVILGVITTFGTTITGFIVSRHTNLINDRKQLADEQHAMREEMRSEINNLKEEVHLWRDRSLRMEDELREWKEKYFILEMEYQKAINRITELENELKRQRGDKHEGV